MLETIRGAVSRLYVIILEYYILESLILLGLFLFLLLLFFFSSFMFLSISIPWIHWPGAGTLGGQETTLLFHSLITEMKLGGMQVKQPNKQRATVML